MIPIAKPQIGEEEKKAVLEVLTSGILTQGGKVKKFEEQFAEFIGAKYAIATNNGTTALYLAQLAAGIGPGDEVITSAFTFIASATTITYCGAKPVFADIDPRTFNLDPKSVKSSVTSKTKAIQPVHLYGQSADMDAIMEVAEEHGLAVIEDACQAHGAEYNGKRVGSIGLAGCFSFYATKNMTTGEGGMITTNNDEIATRCRMLRDQGQRSQYDYAMIGFNFRMTDFTAAIGIEQLKKLEGFNRTRANNAKVLDEGLNGIVEIPYVLPGATHVYHQYTIKCKNRDSLQNALGNDGIASRVYYPRGLHQVEPLKKFASGQRLPRTEDAVSTALSLPVHPAVNGDDLRLIIESVKKHVKAV